MVDITVPPSLEVLESAHARLTAQIQCERVAIAEAFGRIQALLRESDWYASVIKARREPPSRPPAMPPNFYVVDGRSDGRRFIP